MISGKNLIGYSVSAEGSTILKSVSASDGKELKENFIAATISEVNLAVEKAEKAFLLYSKMPSVERANFLEAIAEEIETLDTELIERAIIESGLPKGRFLGERGRTVGQLRLFAQLLKEGNWVKASIDTPLPERKPLPKPDIRKMLFAIGPVVVFTASNFPLAFSTAGGDTASALASGCPVIVKAHDSHLGVNELVSTAIIRAAKKTYMPDGVFSSLNGNGFETGKELVLHPKVKAVAFTGSYNGGIALHKIAHSRKDPIPVFAEMGSINPVILLKEKLSAETKQLAKIYADSITLGVGQLCTNPGLLIGIKSNALDSFKSHLSERLNNISGFTMLNKGIANNYNQLRKNAIIDSSVKLYTNNNTKSGTPTLTSTSAKNFVNNPSLHKEIFGPYSLLVECDNDNQLLKVIESLEGQLTGTLMGSDNDFSEASEIISILQNKVGRLIFNSTPTGVEVCYSMQHGGPAPSTTDSRFTSVGTDAIKRFVRPICLQGMPEPLLPEALKDSNPLNIIRLVDGKFTNKKIV